MISDVITIHYTLSEGTPSFCNTRSSCAACAHSTFLSTAFGGFMTTEIVNQNSMTVKFFDSDGQVLYSCHKTNPRTAKTPDLLGSH
jgi:hypothetical protein